MIKMIIADDEPVIVRGIQKLADWKKFGIEIVGTYEDGQEALRGIIRQNPDIALLDISMPKMTGIEILKELRKMDLHVPVIFISGFTDFEYARAAVKYGAVDYLLKPVSKEELIKAIEKAASRLTGRILSFPSEKEAEKTGAREREQELKYAGMLEAEETVYLPVYVEIFSTSSLDPQARRLLQFSVNSFLEDYMETGGKGIVVRKKESVFLVFKGMEKERAVEEIFHISGKIRQSFACTASFIYGNIVANMKDIPGECEVCMEKKGYLFFREYLTSLILNAGKPVFLRSLKEGEVPECRRRIREAILLGKKEEYEKVYGQFGLLVCMEADGRQENACYHYCSLIKETEEKLRAAGIVCPVFEINDLLEQGRRQKSYAELKDVYKEYLDIYAGAVEESAKKQQSEIVLAKAYIEEHYMENITLEVIAEVVHMNPYYFSSFFKKQAGENFKDYLNKVRLEHALPLVVSGGRTNRDIAAQTGFRDGRAFHKAFLKMYGRAPGDYRNGRQRL